VEYLAVMVRLVLKAAVEVLAQALYHLAGLVKGQSSRAVLELLEDLVRAEREALELLTVVELAPQQTQVAVAVAQAEALEATLAAQTVALALFISTTSRIKK
jgi:hypothetical protein